MIDILQLIILANIDKVYAIAALILVGLVLRFTLELFGQTWIRTKAHTTTILVLPIITYVITNVISGNIALSLGMVGALSIVRFRNPVRSPLELSVYFGSITMGIAAGVSLNWLLLLILAIFAAVTCLLALNLFSRVIFKKTMFSVSFSEGNQLSSMLLVTKGAAPLLDDHELLQSKVFSAQDGNFTYHLASANFERIKKVEQLLNDYDVVSLELRR